VEIYKQHIMHFVTMHLVTNYLLILKFIS